MRQKAELPSPQNSTQTQTLRESKFALLSSLTSSHCVKLPSLFLTQRWSFGYTLAGGEAGLERWSQEGLWRAPGSYTQTGRRRLWILPWSNTHGKYGQSQDGFRKVRKYEKSRLVQKNHRLLNTTHICFYHCTTLFLSGPKHE